MRQVFDNKKIDASLFLQLENLTIALMKEPDASLEYGFQAYYDDREAKVVISHFWDSRQASDRVTGLRSEVYLKALGYKYNSNMEVIREFALELQYSSLSSFLTQLFVLLEDLRVEEKIIQNRSGTKILFKRRKEMYQNYFESQYEINRIRDFQADMLFCLCYMTLTSDTYVSFPNPYWEAIHPMLYEIFQSQTTEDTIRIIKSISYRLEDFLSDDMINIYFGLAPLQASKLQETDESRKKLENCDLQQVTDMDNKDTMDETLSTWHRENKNQEHENFLHFELERGTKTNITSGTARESEDQDQALGSVKGNSQKSSQSSFGQDNPKAISKPPTLTMYQYGKFNTGVVHTVKQARKPSSDEKIKYNMIHTMVKKDVRELKKTIEKTIENKQNASRDTHYGRLHKKFLRIYTEKQPRLFYKKGNESKELDVVFSLLIDCSGSMYNKMEETKKSVVLFHEALQSLRIPHNISGFWEDSSNAKKDYKPNVIHEVISFENSLHGQGPEIMQISEEEDNRDGYIIRVMAEQLAKRPEKHKFLLVFTDGEPSAFDYHQEGILDTHEAVKLARKLGIDVIGIFIEDGEVKDETKELMQNIYNHHYLIANHAEDLRKKVKPLLTKLLLRTIQ
ncbi:vWA domain-containing protein [Ectobacillus polymachus]|uniref:vWA domain-containing protein n=1 Tax=Ectobacillus polymachus TaxID=1508806 RepID=UPI003A883B62